MFMQDEAIALTFAGNEVLRQLYGGNTDDYTDAELAAGFAAVEIIRELADFLTWEQQAIAIVLLERAQTSTVQTHYLLKIAADFNILDLPSMIRALRSKEN